MSTRELKRLEDAITASRKAESDLDVQIADLKSKIEVNKNSIIASKASLDVEGKNAGEVVFQAMSDGYTEMTTAAVLFEKAMEEYRENFYANQKLWLEPLGERFQESHRENTRYQQAKGTQDTLWKLPASFQPKAE